MRPDKAPAVLISHVYGYANKGDWALLDTTCRLILQTFPHSYLYGVCRDPASQALIFPTIYWVRQAGVSTADGWRRKYEVSLQLLWTLCRFSLLSRCTWFKGTATQLLQTFRRADLVIACPGGYLNDASFSIVTNIVHLWLAQRTGQPVLLAPQSVGPVKSAVLRRVLAASLKNVCAVCVRDTYSLRFVLEDLMVPANRVHLLPDMAFTDAEADTSTALVELRALGMANMAFAAATVVGWTFPYSDDPKGANDHYLHEVAAAFKLIYERLGLKTLLLKQVEASPGIEGDDSLMERIFSMASEAVVVSTRNYSPAVFRGVLSRAACFVGSRMHSNIFAVQVGIPVVALAYLPKTRGIMEMLALERYVCDIENVSAESLVETLTTALAHRDDFVRAKGRCAELGAACRERFTALLVASVRDGV